MTTPREKEKALKDKIFREGMKVIPIHQMRGHKVLETFRFPMTADNVGYGIILEGQRICVFFAEHDYEIEERDETGAIHNKIIQEGGFKYRVTDSASFDSYILEKLDEHNIIDLKVFNAYKDYLKNEKEEAERKHREEAEYKQFLELKKKFEEDL